LQEAQLQTDILYRDIAVCHGIRDVASLKRLFTLLLSNAAHLVSPSKLLQPVGVRSPSTILEYFSYLEASYLVQLMPRFAWSAKSQSLSPKKLYVIDSGFIQTGSVSFSPDRGSLLENFAFLEFRRHTDDIYYFSERDRECDFVVHPHGGKPVCAQVCRELNSDNEERELSGLESAMEFFDLANGFILTANQTDTILRNGKTIHVVSAHEFDFGL
jgi:Predicted ATPase (AAA+ superfamily)